MSNRNDELMVRIASGDRDAFSELMYEWQGPLIGFLHRSTRDFQNAEDIAQSVFITVWENAHLYKPGSNFKAWLYKVAKNRAIDGNRKCSREHISSHSTEEQYDDFLASACGDDEEPIDIIEQNEEADRDAQRLQMIRVLLTGLPPEQGYAVYAHYFEGKTEVQIAEDTGSIKSTTARRLQEGRKVIREIMDKMSA